MHEFEVLDELVNLSLTLGKPENDYVILGEGNTSAKVDDEYFYVKASGKYLSNSTRDTFVKVKHKTALAILENETLEDSQVKSALKSACADPNPKALPSIETTFHAYLLSLPDINFVGHTHATAVNSLLASKNADEIINGGRIFPDEIVYCGIEPIFMEFFDPGMQLAKQIKSRVEAYEKKHNCLPKVILIRNHGIIALGKTAHQVEAITAMYCKTARALMGAMNFGGINYLSQSDVDRIYTRPDEADRQSQFK